MHASSQGPAGRQEGEAVELMLVSSQGPAGGQEGEEVELKLASSQGPAGRQEGEAVELMLASSRGPAGGHEGARWGGRQRAGMAVEKIVKEQDQQECDGGGLFRHHVGDVETTYHFISEKPRGQPVRPAGARQPGRGEDAATTLPTPAQGRRPGPQRVRGRLQADGEGGGDGAGGPPCLEAPHWYHWISRSTRPTSQECQM